MVCFWLSTRPTSRRPRLDLEAAGTEERRGGPAGAGTGTTIGAEEKGAGLIPPAGVAAAGTAAAAAAAAAAAGTAFAAAAADTAAADTIAAAAGTAAADKILQLRRNKHVVRVVRPSANIHF